MALRRVLRASYTGSARVLGAGTVEDSGVAVSGAVWTNATAFYPGAASLWVSGVTWTVARTFSPGVAAFLQDQDRRFRYTYNGTQRLLANVTAPASYNIAGPVWSVSTLFVPGIASGAGVADGVGFITTTLRAVESSGGGTVFGRTASGIIEYTGTIDTTLSPLQTSGGGTAFGAGANPGIAIPGITFVLARTFTPGAPNYIQSVDTPGYTYILSRSFIPGAVTVGSTSGSGWRPVRAVGGNVAWIPVKTTL